MCHNLKSDRVKIGFISQFSPDDRRASSGTNYKMVEQFKKWGEVKWIPLKYTLAGRCLIKLGSIIQKYSSINLLVPMTEFAARVMYRKYKQKDLLDYDVLVAFFCSNYYYNFPKNMPPVVYFSDATFPAMLGYYSDFSNLPNFNIRMGIEIEKKCMMRISQGVFSSNWAYESAIRDLGLDRDRANVVEFGANIDDCNISYKAQTGNYHRNYVNILFLGVEWERKGGGIAVETVEWLNNNGVNAKLQIVGINKEDSIEGKHIVNHGFLNKNKPNDYQKLVDIISTCDCMLLPTIAECAGIAFAEASAFGLPSFTHDTGGVSNYVISGINGYLLPIGCKGEGFGRKILECIKNGELYKMKSLSRKLYEEKLNWDTWGNRVRSIVLTAIENRKTV